MIWITTLLLLLLAGPTWAGGNLSLFDLTDKPEPSTLENRKPADKPEQPTQNITPSSESGQPLNPLAPAEDDDEDEEDMGC